MGMVAVDADGDIRERPPGCGSSSAAKRPHGARSPVFPTPDMVHFEPVSP